MITTPVTSIQTRAIIPCSIDPSVFFPFDTIINLRVDNVFSKILDKNIIMYISI